MQLTVNMNATSSFEELTTRQSCLGGRVMQLKVGLDVFHHSIPTDTSTHISFTAAFLIRS